MLLPHLADRNTEAQSQVSYVERGGVGVYAASKMVYYRAAGLKDAHLGTSGDIFGHEDWGGVDNDAAN